MTEYDEAHERGYLGTSPDDTPRENYGLQGGEGGGLTYSTSGEEPVVWIGPDYRASHPEMVQYGSLALIPVTVDDTYAEDPPVQHTLTDGRVAIDNAGFYLLQCGARWHFADPDTNALLPRPDRGSNYADVMGFSPGGDTVIWYFRLTLTPPEVGDGMWDVFVEQAFLVPINAGTEIGLRHWLGMQDAPAEGTGVRPNCESFLYSFSVTISQLAQ